MHVLPPANGKKLWRIKRSVSGSPSSADASSSLECYNSSQRISAAGKQFMSRRPPLKRPKSKPGMPKDFVFVDLSPVKSEEKLSEENVEKLPGNTDSDVSSPTVDTVFSDASPSSSFSSFSNYNYASDDLYGPCFDESLLGLGLMGVDFPEQMQPQPVQMPQPQTQTVTPQQQTFPQFDMSFGQVSPISPTQLSEPMQQTPQQQQPQHKRRKSAGGYTFKSYTGPNGGVKKRKSQNHRRCFSEPAKKPQPQQQAPTPPSMDEFLHVSKDEKFDGFDFSMVDEMGSFAYGEEKFKEEFDFQSYLSI